MPYEQLGVAWGKPSTRTLCFIYNHSLPPDFLRWYFTTGAGWRSPVIQEWLRAKRCFLWSDVAKRLQEKIDPELRERVERANLQHGLGGGFVSHELFVVFYASMPTEESGREHLPMFERIIPYYAQASQRAHPRDLLTGREKLILRHRVAGQVAKQVAATTGISERTVKMHFQRIKKKLGTDDLLNAAVIANMHGMLNIVGE